MGPRLTDDRFSYYCSAILQVSPVLNPNLLVKSMSKGSFLSGALQDKWASLTTSGSSFDQLELADLCGPELLRLILRQRYCFRFMEPYLLGLYQPTDEELRLAFTVQLSCEYQLLSLPFQHPNKPLTPTQEAVRLTLYAAFQPILDVSRPHWAFQRSIRLQLWETLRDINVPGQNVSENELLLWLYLIFAHLSSDQEGWYWAVSCVSELNDALGLQTLGQLEFVLGSFYIPRDSFRQSVRKVWTACTQAKHTRWRILVLLQRFEKSAEGMITLKEQCFSQVNKYLILHMLPKEDIHPSARRL